MRLNWKSLSSLLIGILKEVEELCTKFLQYRIDSRNLIHFLKNTIKYDTPDLRDVVIARLLKDAEKAFENEQMLDKPASNESVYDATTGKYGIWVDGEFVIDANKRHEDVC